MELWTKEHAVTLIPAVAVMLILGIILRKALGEKDLKIRMIPFQILTCILLLLEAGKQILSLKQGYDLYHLPFHFCSLFIFALPAMSFYKGKHRNTVSAITTALCASVFLLMLIYPNLIYSGAAVTEFFTNFFSFHTVAFHNIVMLECVLILALQLHIPEEKGEPMKIVWFIIVFCVVSATMAHLLKTNYANYYTCNIPVLETVRLAVAGVLGNVVAKLLYILIVSLLNVGFVLGCYWLYRLLLRVKIKTPQVL